jgi:DNA-binding transcriptional ArsR family regulator
VVTNEAREEGFGVLGDRSRRAIVLLLADGPRAVGELADELPITRPAVSQHLKVLKGAGLVDEEPVGTRRIYRINEAGLLALRDQLDTFWTERSAPTDAPPKRRLHEPHRRHRGAPHRRRPGLGMRHSCPPWIELRLAGPAVPGRPRLS